MAMVPCMFEISGDPSDLFAASQAKFKRVNDMISMLISSSIARKCQRQLHQHCENELHLVVAGGPVNQEPAAELNRIRRCKATRKHRRSHFFRHESRMPSKSVKTASLNECSSRKQRVVTAHRRGGRHKG